MLATWSLMVLSFGKARGVESLNPGLVYSHWSRHPGSFQVSNQDCFADSDGSLNAPFQESGDLSWLSCVLRTWNRSSAHQGSPGFCRRRHSTQAVCEHCSGWAAPAGWADSSCSGSPQAGLLLPSAPAGLQMPAPFCAFWPWPAAVPLPGEQ